MIFGAVCGPSRALPSRALGELARIVEAGELTDDELTAWKDDRLIRAQRDGLVDDGILPAGNVSGAITELIDVAGFLPRMVDDAVAVLNGVCQRMTVQPDETRKT